MPFMTAHKTAATTKAAPDSLIRRDILCITGLPTGEYIVYLLNHRSLGRRLRHQSAPAEQPALPIAGH